uniref:Arginine--tRNA ligase n=1 Tax=Panagrolaimus sp. ES5 TaxID=591445 RepID=A0AC34FAE0_9BILA
MSSNNVYTEEDAAKARLSSYEEQLTKLKKQFELVQQGTPDEETLDHMPDLKAALVTNAKLKYHKNFLQKSIETVEKDIKSGTFKKPTEDAESSTSLADLADQKKSDNPGKKGKGNEQPPVKKDKKEAKPSVPKINYVVVEDYGDSLMSRLKEVFSEAQKTAYPQVPNFPPIITEATNPKFGDYQCNSALGLSKKLKEFGVNDSPPQVAKNIANAVQTGDFIKEIEIAGPGFINVHLQPEFLGTRIGKLLQNGIQPPKIAKRKALVDFSSPNIAKEMHVGHLRSTIIGDTICRLMEFFGFDVLRINHVGDWGTQFGMLIAHLQDRFPNYLNETPPIGDLQAFYKESKKRFDEDEAFKARAYDRVVKLQNHDPEIIKAWKMICDVSRADFNKIYEKLDIKITERGESFYQEYMVKLVKELEEKNILITEEGRKIFFPTGCTVPLTIVKSDGGYTYDTSDLAAVKQRIDEEKVDWAIYVVDSGQSLHLETVYAAARDLGYYKPEEKRIEHVGFGVVLGEDKKKFKTRSGDTVRLTDLLNEGIKMSEEKLIENNRNEVLSEAEFNAAKEAVAYGCIKYADLASTRTNDYIFSHKRMLNITGNTAAYLLYAYARIRSIARNAGVSRETLVQKLKDQNGIVAFEHPVEIKLAKQILKFSETLLSVLDSFYLHLLCEYLYNLSTTFTEFYTECQVVEKKDGKIQSINYNRLSLCEATVDTMTACFQILGIRTLEKI